MKFIASIFLLISSAFGAELMPLNDNILFAFDKCRIMTIDLMKGQMDEKTDKSFDIHCINSTTDKTLFKCDFFDAGSNRKIAFEILNGGKSEKIGSLQNKSGINIQFNTVKGSASFVSSDDSKDGLSVSRKMCVGIYLLEKDALTRKKQI